MAPPLPSHPEAVLDFWFSLQRPGKKDDGLVRVALGGLYKRAARGELSGWAEGQADGRMAGGVEAPRGRLALILLLDQTPRHLFRGDARIYATDAMAAELTAWFLERSPDTGQSRQDDCLIGASPDGERGFMGASLGGGRWAGLRPLEIFYAAHPWLHAEHEQRQARINPVFHRIAPQLPGLEYMANIADLYWETIRRFGRFPHRNTMLERETTEAEARFLAEEWNQRRREARGWPLTEANPYRKKEK